MSGNRRKPFGVRITVGFEKGKQKYKYIGYYEKQTEANLALAEYNKAPFEFDTVNITFKEVYERYIAEETISAPSLRNRKTSFNHCKALYDKKFKDLRRTHLQGVINSLETRTAKSIVALLFRKMYAFAIANDIVSKDYSLTLNVPSKNRKAEKSIFTDEEIKKLWSIRGNINADILLILLYSGMRINELLKLRKEKIFLEENYLIAGSKTEAGKDRYIPIHHKIKPILAEYINANDTPYLFLGATKKPIRYDSYQRKRFAPLMKKLEMSHTIHETRHTAITRLHNAGANPLAVKRIVGHADETTEGYTHLEKALLHETINLLT